MSAVIPLEVKQVMMNGKTFGIKPPLLLTLSWNNFEKSSEVELYYILKALAVWFSRLIASFWNLLSLVPEFPRNFVEKGLYL